MNHMKGSSELELQPCGLFSSWIKLTVVSCSTDQHTGVTSPCLMSANTNPASVCFSVSPEDLDRCVFPLFPGTPLSPTSLLALKQGQIGSAVSLLDFYCRKNYWSQPEYHLYSTPGQDGKLLLLYKVPTPIPTHNYTFNCCAWTTTSIVIDRLVYL